MSYSVLIVDDEVKLCRNISLWLKSEGFDTYQAHTGQDAINLSKRETMDVVILDYMLTDMTGLDVLMKIKEESPEVPVIMLTAYGNIESAVQAMKLGAVDYLNKPVELAILKEIVVKTCENKRLKLENRLLKEEVQQTRQHDDLVYENKKMKSIIDFLEKVVNTEASVLLLGESGVGKTALAKWIHKRSNRKEKPFVSINCAAIPENLLESELFGYQKGAFTGATETRAGKFEAADKGTIFLDEIGEISLTVQAKLLHVIEEKSFMRLGSNSYRKVDVRIISATNKDIKRLVKEGKFREDLYYRLNLVEVEVPPLRERREDIPFIIRRYIEKLNRKYLKEVGVSDDVIQFLTSYEWPGNIREMLNIVERLHILKMTGTIEESDLSRELFNFSESLEQKGSSSFNISDGNLKKTLENVEEQLIKKALKETGGNRSKAADILGIARHTLVYKIKKIQMGEDK
ncbi:DNA-binding NtrC family response regulator [Bacillus fengqiuensis]|nr:DNA-binding NtrC family response regulator [Bacillus fengqiuensis]